MPTLRQRFLGLAGNDAADRRRHLRAWQWAKERLPDHIVHVEGTSVRLFPDGGLDAAAEYSDAELQVFVGWVVLVRLSYNAFY